MPWVRLDDNFFSHPRTVGLSTTCVTLYLRALCYASQHLTDGYVSVAAIESWGVRRWRESADTLLERGLWTRPTVDHGSTMGRPWPPDPMVDEWYQIRDYLDYQRSAEEARKLSRKRAAAGSKGGSKKAANQKQPSSNLLPAVLAHTAQQNSSSSPPHTSTPHEMNNGSGGPPPEEDSDEYQTWWVTRPDTLDRTWRWMAQHDLAAARATGTVVRNETAWLKAAAAARANNHHDQACAELERRTHGIHYPLHVEIAEHCDPAVGPPDGGAARADNRTRNGAAR